MSGAAAGPDAMMMNTLVSHSFAHVAPKMILPDDALCTTCPLIGRRSALGLPVPAAVWASILRFDLIRRTHSRPRIGAEPIDRIDPAWATHTRGHGNQLPVIPKANTTMHCVPVSCLSNLPFNARSLACSTHLRMHCPSTHIAQHV